MEDKEGFAGPTAESEKDGDMRAFSCDVPFPKRIARSDETGVGGAGAPTVSERADDGEHAAPKRSRGSWTSPPRSLPTRDGASKPREPLAT